MGDVLDDLLKHWKRHKVASAAFTATKDEVTAWEEKYSVKLPDDLRTYVTRVNGSYGAERLDFDHEGFSFLPLSAIAPEAEWSKHPDGTDKFVIVDVLVQCYWWCAEITARPCRETKIFLGQTDKLVACSLEEFLRAYMSGSKSIHP